MSKIRTKHRPDLWFGKYDHCIRVWMREASCLRYMNHDRARYILTRRREWGQRMVANMNGKQPGSWHWAHLDISDRDESNIMTMLDFLLADQRDYRKTVSGDWIWFYSNDASFIDDIENLPCLDRRGNIQRTQISLEGTPGTVRLRESQHRYRSYFRGYMKLTEQQETALAQYLANLEDIRLSPSLQEWVEDSSPKYYIGDYYFIDHDDMGIVTMLSLIISGLIRRTKPIEIAK